MSALVFVFVYLLTGAAVAGLTIAWMGDDEFRAKDVVPLMLAWPFAIVLGLVVFAIAARDTAKAKRAARKESR